MYVRLEPGGRENENLMRFAGSFISASDAAFFYFIEKFLSGEVSETDILSLDPASTRPPDQDIADDWFDRGWREAFWLHTSRQSTPYDSDDASGCVRETAIYSYLDEDPVPLRRRLVGSQSVALSLKAEGSAQHNSFADCIGRLAKRRTRRRFRTEPIELSALTAILLQATERIRRNRIHEGRRDLLHQGLLRSYGCWLELGVVVFNVKGLEPGLYRFDIEACSLEQISCGCFRDHMSKNSWEQPAPLTASFTLIMFVDFAQARWRYRHERALRNVFVELGRVANDFILRGLERGISSFVTPAIKETELAALFRTTPLDLFPAYTVTQGR